ncbi:helix-turn-helix domain-containing protein [Sorangium sp. So ce233]|uniref:helix-turn-helix domain-containing protein n=1 Tax=Sorangium sp. So ce233 TaxID=3133290 RepID=UPI003F63807C
MTARAPHAAADPAAITAELRRDIAAAMAAAGLSQRRLSAVSGVGQRNISLALSGAADPHVSTVVQLIEATGHRLMVGHRPLAELLTGATDPPLSAVVRLVDALGYRLRIEKAGNGP